MRVEASLNSEFLRPFFSRLPVAPWILFLVLFAVLAAMRYYAVLGPEPARPLFLVQILILLALPAIFLTPQGRQAIGLCKPRRMLPALALATLGGALVSIVLFAADRLFLPDSPASLFASIRDGMQLDRLRATMPIAAILAVVGVPAIFVTPIAEEIFYRGVLHHAFACRWNVAVATVVNGLAFGLVHLHLGAIYRDASGFHFRVFSALATIVSLLLVSALFTYCRNRSGSLYAAMAAHAACNLTMIGAAVVRYSI